MDERRGSGDEITLTSFLLERVARDPDFVAVTLDEHDIRYGELEERVARCAKGLANLGVRKGDRVALVLPNVPTFVIAAYAILRLGAVVVNINVATRGAELRRLLVDSGARAAVTLDVFLLNVLGASRGTPVETVIAQSVTGAPLPADVGDDGPTLRPFAELLASGGRDELDATVRVDDLAVIQYTSGATGSPKAVALSHGNIVSNVLQIERALPHEDFGNGAVICILPFFHVFGMTTCLHLSVRKGYRMVLAPRFDWSSVLALVGLIERHRPVSLPAVPPLWAALVSHRGVADVPLASIEIPSSGGAPLPAWVQQRFRELTGRWIVEAYGLSETSSTTHMNALDREPLPGCVGVPLSVTQAKIVDVETGTEECPVGVVGELLVKGPQVFKGYWRNPELTAAALRDGWLHTGDLARRDESGRTFIVDRKDDLIISRGYNVSPAEVEAALIEHPDVKDVAVVGAPDALRGSSVVAVVAKTPSSSVGEEELLRFCRGHLSDFEVPGAIHFRDALPRNPAGKLLRRRVRDELLGTKVEP